MWRHALRFVQSAWRHTIWSPAQRNGFHYTILLFLIIHNSFFFKYSYQWKSPLLKCKCLPMIVYKYFRHCRKTKVRKLHPLPPTSSIKGWRMPSVLYRYLVYLPLTALAFLGDLPLYGTRGRTLIFDRFKLSSFAFICLLFQGRILRGGKTVNSFPYFSFSKQLFSVFIMTCYSNIFRVYKKMCELGVWVKMVS